MSYRPMINLLREDSMRQKKMKRKKKNQLIYEQHRVKPVKKQRREKEIKKK